jgi:aconitate hydratase
MGVLPLEYRDGDTAESLGLDGTEVFEVDIDDTLVPRQPVLVRAIKSTGGVIEIKALARVDTPVEVDYLRNGGILHYVLRQMAD